MATTEHTINDAIADLLSQTRFAWRGDDIVVSENTGQFLESKALQPDIVIKEPFTAAVVIETELLPAQSVQPEALARLGKELSNSGQSIHSSIAVRLPHRLREASRRRLKRIIAEADDLQFALFTPAKTLRNSTAIL